MRQHVLQLLGTLAGLGLMLSPAAMAQEQPGHAMTGSDPMPERQGEFRQLDQPLSLKLAVTAAGAALIGLECWWFLISKPAAQRSTLQSTASGQTQQLTIDVDGGYSPSQVIVKAGKPVQLHFLRHDPNSCLEKVLIPDFHIAVDLPLERETTVEFTPEQTGEYAFTCGMNMFRGVIRVEA